MQDIWKNTVYHPKWQAIRVGLKGKWATLNGAASNILECDTYLGEQPNISQVWRVLNCLNGTLRGLHGMSNLDPAVIPLIEQFRNELSDKFAECDRRGEKPEEITAELFVAEWALLKGSSRSLIIADLSQRLKNHDESKFREDLRWALDQAFLCEIPPSVLRSVKSKFATFKNSNYGK